MDDQVEMHRTYSLLTLLLALAAPVCAQEVQYVDLTAAPQHVEIRRPPPPPSEPNGDTGIGSGWGSVSVGDCAPDVRDVHAVAVYLEPLDGEIDPSRPFQVELRFVNTGRLPVNIPVSPDLSDLQPADPAVTFRYFSLALAVRGRGASGLTAYIELYGADDHKDTMRVLRSGEWIRVKANLRLEPQPANCTAITLEPGFWLRTNQIHATYNGMSTEANGLCLNQTPTPSVTALCVERSAGAASNSRP